MKKKQIILITSICIILGVIIYATITHTPSENINTPYNTTTNLNGNWIIETVKFNNINCKDNINPDSMPQQVTMEINTQSISGKGPVNLYSASLNTHKKSMQISSIATTKKAGLGSCSEQAYLNFLRSPLTYTISNHKLILKSNSKVGITEIQYQSQSH